MRIVLRISCTLISKSEITSHNWELRGWGWRSQACAARRLSAEARTFWLLLLWDFLRALDRASVNVLMDCEVFCVLRWIRSRDINEILRNYMKGTWRYEDKIKLCKSFRTHCRLVTSEEWRPVARSPPAHSGNYPQLSRCHASRDLGSFRLLRDRAASVMMRGLGYFGHI